MFDITNRASFQSVPQYVATYKLLSGSPFCRSILVGNKVDLETQRQVTVEEATHLASEFGMEYFEVSAKQDLNLKEAFHQFGKTMVAAN